MSIFTNSANEQTDAGVWRKLPTIRYHAVRTCSTAFCLIRTPLTPNSLLRRLFKGGLVSAILISLWNPSSYGVICEAPTRDTFNAGLECLKR